MISLHIGYQKHTKIKNQKHILQQFLKQIIYFCANELFYRTYGKEQ